MNTRRAIITTTFLAGLLVASACSSSVSRSSATDAQGTVGTSDSVVTQDVTTTSVVGGEGGGGGGGGTPSTASGGGVTTSSYPKITPVTKAAPPATTTTGLVMATISVQSLVPDVLTLTGKTLFQCGDIPLSGKTSVSWTTSKANSVRLTIDSSRAVSGLPAIGSYAVPLICGDTQKVTVTAIGSNGTVGRSKTISITVMP